MPEEYIIFTEPQNPYLRAYFRATQKTIGDCWTSVGYILWIENKQNEFHKLHGLPEHIVLNEEETKEFINYLNLL